MLGGEVHVTNEMLHRDIARLVVVHLCRRRRRADVVVVRTLAPVFGNSGRFQFQIARRIVH